jgi:hypothetical protein
MELHIEQQVFRAGGRVQIGPVKTKAGERDLPLLEVVSQFLINWQRQHDNFVPDGLAFTTSTGQPIEPQNYTRTFQQLCAKYQIRRIRLHDLRHGVATLLKDLGVPDKDVQLIMGHSNISITQKIYQHDTMASRRVALDQVGEALLSANVVERMTNLDGNAMQHDFDGCRQDCRQTPATPSLAAQFNSSPEDKNKPATGVPVAGWLDNFLGEPQGDTGRNPT